jgi:hypothetical protein
MTAPRAAACPVAAEAPDELCCPIRLTLFLDPVVLLGDMQRYERAAIEQWLAKSMTSPLTGVRVEGDTVPDDVKRMECERWRSRTALSRAAHAGCPQCSPRVSVTPITPTSAAIEWTDLRCTPCGPDGVPEAPPAPPATAGVRPWTIASARHRNDANHYVTLRERFSRLVAAATGTAPPRMARWEPDASRRACALCERRFSRLFRWRHHCRQCGRIVCDACSLYRSAPFLGQRLCSDCGH